MSSIIVRPFDRPCRLIEWKRWPSDNQALIGHAAISFNGWTVHHIPAFCRADSTLIVGPPNVAKIHSGGRIRQSDAKKQNRSIMTLDGTEARELWQRAGLIAAGIREVV